MSEPTPTPGKSIPPEGAWTSRRLLDWIRGHLEAKGVDAPRVCAEHLVAHVLGCDRLRLYMEPDRLADPGELDSLRGLVARAAGHEPVQYLVGSWPFHGREFAVAPCALIPRPSTEALVERALSEVATRGASESWRILDLCTGCGCIAVSLAASIQAARSGRISERFFAGIAGEEGSEFEATDVLPVLDLDLQQVDEVTPVATPKVSEPKQDGPLGELAVIATDVMEDALALAGNNAERLGAEAVVELRAGSLFEPLHENERRSFDIICANPPYVSDVEYEKLDRNVREYEPEIALRGGVQGLDLVEPIIREAPRWLRSRGLLLVEIGDAMKEDVRTLAQETEGLEVIEVLADHEGYNRVMVAYAI